MGGGGDNSQALGPRSPVRRVAGSPAGDRLWGSRGRHAESRAHTQLPKGQLCAQSHLSQHQVRQTTEDMQLPTKGSRAVSLPLGDPTC